MLNIKPGFQEKSERISMSNSTSNYKTIEDFMLQPEDSRAELIDGKFYPKMLPSGDHSYAEGKLYLLIASHFFQKFNSSDSTGGWWILHELSIYYPKSERILTADIAGFKRTNTPERPKGYPVKNTPDWICEVCYSTKKKDTTIVPETLASQGVEWYWLMDLKDENLQVWHLNENKKFELTQSLFKDDEKKRIFPFDAIEIEMKYLLGEE